NLSWLTPMRLWTWILRARRRYEHACQSRSMRARKSSRSDLKSGIRANDLTTEPNSDAKPPSSAEAGSGLFSNSAFVVIVVATSLSSVGLAMFDTGSAWLMTSLNPSPRLVSAVQVAATLPLFLLTLPAGALTDVVDPRRL